MTDYEDQILRSLRRITRAIDLYSRQLAAKHGLTVPQLVCLRALRRLGPVTPGRLSQEVELSQATVTGIIDRLSQRGLVDRTRNEDDRRRVTVTLTKGGTEVMEGAPSPLQERFVDRLHQLGEDQQSGISTTLELIVRMMDAEDIDVAPILATGMASATEEDLQRVLEEDG